MKAMLEKIPMSLLLGLFMLYLAYSYYMFANAPDSPLNVRQAQQASNAQTIKVLEDKLERAKQFYATLDAKRTELRNLNQELDNMRTSLSSELDIPGFIKMVVTEATKVGLKVSSIKPTEQKSTELYVEQAFDLTYQGVFVQLLVFLDRISNLERILRIDNFDIKRLGPSSAPYVEVVGTIQIKAYRYVAAAKAGAP